MSTKQRSRMVMAGFGLAFLSAAVAYFLAVSREELVVDLMLLVMAVLVGIPLSGITERFLVGPAERLMNLVTGFGVKGQDAEFDERGVPLVSLRRLGEKFYNPVAVAMAAMRYYDVWEQKGEKAALESFRNCCDSLLEHLAMRSAGSSTFAVWEYGYRFTYGMVPPWVSGLAQGVGVQVLSRAHRATGEKRYVEGAQQALRAFSVTVGDGGVTYKDSEETWWYEEFAAAGAQVSRVLNGMIYALLGIREYGKNTKDPEALVLFEKGSACLREVLPEYDAGWWTYYDIVGTVATKSYHAVHVDLIRQMFEATGDEAFREAYRRWTGYRTHFFLREFIRSKPSWHDQVVLGLNIVGTWLLLRLVILPWTMWHGV